MCLIQNEIDQLGICDFWKPCGIGSVNFSSAGIGVISDAMAGTESTKG